VKSFWIGWGSLIVAGAGAFYFAKKEINADRREKYLQRQQRQHEQDMLRYGNESAQMNPSSEASSDPAPTRHVPQTEQENVHGKSKYEATAVYRSPKGDRFS